MALVEQREGVVPEVLRKMAADPFAFYRGSACLFYADMSKRDDPWADERTSRVWIQGDLHAENFGTYMDANGRLIAQIAALAPKGERRMGANPHANGGRLLQDLRLPDFRVSK